MKESPTVQAMNASARTIAEIFADHCQTAKIFEKHGIDFCCGGNVAPAATVLIAANIHTFEDIANDRTGTRRHP